MKKKILILLIPFLLTGCASVNYELDIDKNINVSEKVKITATSDFFNIYYKNLPITIVKEFYNDSDIQNKLNSNNYKQRIKRKNFYIKNGFKDANYTIKERNIIYDMLYCNKKVTLQEFQELIKNYFGKILYLCFYKNK